MALQPVVIEISSDDEDVDTDKTFESSIDWLSELFGPRDEDVGTKKSFESSFDCLSELFRPRYKESGKAADVVVVDKLSCAAPMQKQNSLPSNTARGAQVDESDDECQILDGDPDYKVVAIQDKVDGSDDLLVVGEKILLACRDYPHARHLCATFPFSTTPHETHCNMCYCYVCDSLAPCLYWGCGVSSTDHCHSSDKEERWKVQRKSFKTSIGATDQPQNLPDSTSLFNRGRIPSLPRPPGPRLALSPTLIPKSHPLCACSTTSFGIPNIISQRHSGWSVTHSNLKSRKQLNRHSVVVPGMHPSTRDRRSPGAPPSPPPVNTKLYFGNLPYYCESAELAGVIQEYGSPEMVEVLYDIDTGRSRGFAFVTMSSLEDCEAVIQNLDGSRYGGRTLRVNFALYPETEYKLFVGNLSWSVTSESLTQVFREYGNVVVARVFCYGDTGRSRGCGFVCYSSKAEMDAALESLNGVEFEGRTLRIRLALGKCS